MTVKVRGFCLAGGSEPATCCDLVYMADDAQMGYPAVRFGVPDNHFCPWFLGMRKAMKMTTSASSTGRWRSWACTPGRGPAASSCSGSSTEPSAARASCSNEVGLTDRTR